MQKQSKLLVEVKDQEEQVSPEVLEGNLTRAVIVPQGDHPMALPTDVDHLCGPKPTRRVLVGLVDVKIDFFSGLQVEVLGSRRRASVHRTP